MNRRERKGRRERRENEYLSRKLNLARRMPSVLGWRRHSCLRSAGMADPGQRRMADKNVCPTGLKTSLGVSVGENLGLLPGGVSQKQIPRRLTLPAAGRRRQAALGMTLRKVTLPVRGGVPPRSGGVAAAVRGWRGGGGISRRTILPRPAGLSPRCCLPPSSRAGRKFPAGRSTPV